MLLDIGYRVLLDSLYYVWARTGGVAKKQLSIGS
jgi:hypothetical protein